MKNQKVIFSVLGVAMVGLFILRASEGGLLRALAPFVILPLAIGLLLLKDRLFKKR